ncbi:MAG: carboxypeptidase-like regulatory domain-containing protein [Planctomycetaceae bacterium]|nr:carboxypeptidase-like regulatory domain-containing protein [Planctomycetaceae bacterium]
MQKRFFIILLSAFFLGCSQGATRVSIEGTVTLDGKPVDNAVVTIRPEAGPGAGTKTDANGNFSIPKNEGPMAGNAQIMVEKFNIVEEKSGDGKIDEVLVPALPPDIQVKPKPYVIQKGKNKIDIKLEEWRNK